MTDGSFAQGLLGITLDGRYRLDAVLGEGGMGSVFRATHLAMDRKVAVKLLKPHLTSDDAALQRFAREARATLKVESPHAVKILDFGVTPQRDYYMVLEYLDGRTVHRELEIDGPFAPARVAHIARQALEALGAAHTQGLIHRDVKPDNLLLMRVRDDADYTKILDFGVAKLMQGAGDPSQLALTAAGTVFGTPEFMSPEQACGQTLDARSDLYSLAATMFTMLTGRALFEGKTAIELLTHHASTPPPHLAMVRPELDAHPELDELLQRCLAKRRELRPDSAAAMSALVRELEPALARRLDAPRPPAAIEGRPAPPAIYSSSYVQALRDTEPADTRSGDPESAGPPLSSSLPRSAAWGRLRLGVWLGGAAMASVLGLGIGLALRSSTSRTDSRNTSISAPISDPISAPAGRRPPVESTAAPRAGDDGQSARATGEPAAVAHTAASTTTAPPAAGPQATAQRPAAERGVIAHTAAASSPVGPEPTAPRRSPPARTVVDEHLRNAEEALRTGNHLRQIAEADLALHADPRNMRARYLVGDGLIKSGDVERGCDYLRALKRMAVARERARAAGCPGD